MRITEVDQLRSPGSANNASSLTASPVAHWLCARLVLRPSHVFCTLSESSARWWSSGSTVSDHRQIKSLAAASRWGVHRSSLALGSFEHHLLVWRRLPPLSLLLLQEAPRHLPSQPLSATWDLALPVKCPNLKSGSGPTQTKKWDLHGPLGAALAEFLALNAVSSVPSMNFGGLYPAGVAQAFTAAPLQCTVCYALVCGVVVLASVPV